MSLLALAWLAEVGLMTYRINHQGRPAAAGGYKVPWPADFLATFVVFGSLSVLAEVPSFDKVAAIAGWGFVVATVINLVDPTQPNSLVKSTKAGQQQPNPNVGTAQPQSSNPLVLALGGKS